MTHRLWVYLVAIVVLLGAVVFSPSGGGYLWLRTLHDFAHGPIFGAVAIITLMGCRNLAWCAHRPVGSQYLFAFILAVTLGALSELAQIVSNRDPTWTDLAMDVLGAATFLLVFAAFDQKIISNKKGAKRLLALAAIVALAVLVSPLISTALAYTTKSRAFPIIVDFSRDVGAEFLTTRLVSTRIETLPEPLSGITERAMYIQFQPGRWQGIDMREAPRNWLGFRALVLDVANPTEEELKIVLRIDDRGYNGPYHDRYNGRFDISPRSRSILRIPLTEIESAPQGRSFNLSNITRVLLFRQHESKASAMYLVGMRLE